MPFLLQGTSTVLEARPGLGGTSPGAGRPRGGGRRPDASEAALAALNLSISSAATPILVLIYQCRASPSNRQADPRLQTVWDPYLVGGHDRCRSDLAPSLSRRQHRVLACPGTLAGPHGRWPVISMERLMNHRMSVYGTGGAALVAPCRRTARRPRSDSHNWPSPGWNDACVSRRDGG
jgi:hypothetical protein